MNKVSGNFHAKTKKNRITRGKCEFVTNGKQILIYLQINIFLDSFT